MDKIIRGITTAAQANREADFVASTDRFRSDGYFDTRSSVSTGEVIQIKNAGAAKKAKVVRATQKLDGVVRIYFRWLDETTNGSSI